MFYTDLVDKRLINVRSAYQLAQDLIWDDGTYRVIVPAKFIYNGASAPLLLNWLIPKKGDKYDRAVCLHDWLYATGIYPKSVSDKLFYRAMRADNVPRWKARAMYLSVSYLGVGNYNKATEEEKKKLLSLLV